MMIDLVHGEPIRFGADRQRGVVMGSDGQLRLVDVADVGEDALLVHDARRDDPSLAFALARLNTDDHSPTPFGMFRDVERQEYASAIAAQLAQASERKGPGDLAASAALERHLELVAGLELSAARVIPGRSGRSCGVRSAGRRPLRDRPEADGGTRAPSPTIRRRGRGPPSQRCDPATNADRAVVATAGRLRAASPWPVTVAPECGPGGVYAVGGRRARFRRPTTTAPAADGAPTPSVDLAEAIAEDCTIKATKLAVGDAGADVAACSRGSSTAGYFDGEVNGSSARRPTRRCAALQEERKLFVDGVVGRETALSVGVWPDEQ